jgi:hypothetical protein
MPRGGSPQYFADKALLWKLTWLAVRGCATSALRPYGPLGRLGDLRCQAGPRDQRSLGIQSTLARPSGRWAPRGLSLLTRYHGRFDQPAPRLAGDKPPDDSDTADGWSNCRDGLKAF